MTARPLTAAAARGMSERDFQRAVTDLCVWLHLACFHPLNSRGMNPGWPDLVIIGTSVLYRELKSEHGSLMPDQRRVGDLLIRAGGDWAVWRPRDLRSGLIERQLRQLLPPPTLPFPDRSLTTGGR